MEIRLTVRDEEIQSCFAVMAELRSHVVEAEFLERVRRQMDSANYELACVEDGGEVCAVAGFRRSECLAWGRFLYVDDLITTGTARSKGYGKALLDWLVDYARGKGCDELHLDSGVQRESAHRFYKREGMNVSSYHFDVDLRSEGAE